MYFRSVLGPLEWWPAGHPWSLCYDRDSRAASESSDKDTWELKKTQLHGIPNSELFYNYHQCFRNMLHLLMQLLINVVAFFWGGGWLAEPEIMRKLTWRCSLTEMKCVKQGPLGHQYLYLQYMDKVAWRRLCIEKKMHASRDKFFPIHTKFYSQKSEWDIRQQT